MSSSVSFDVQVPSQLPPDRVFKFFRDFDNLAPKVMPQVFKSIERLQGNGDAGTIKKFEYGDAVPYKSAKVKVDALDPSNYRCDYSIIEGDGLMGILDSINYHIKVVSSSEGGSVFKQTIVYNCKGAEKPSEDFLKKDKESHENTFKAIQAYAADHPGVF